MNRNKTGKQERLDRAWRKSAASRHERSQSLRGSGLLHHAVYCRTDGRLSWLPACSRHVRRVARFGKMLLQIGGWIQLIGGFLIAFGLLTRLAAFICSGMFAVAYFLFHVAPATTLMARFFPISSASPQFSNKGELAVVYGWFFFFVFFYGPGRWSIDALIGRGGAAKR